MNEKEYQKFIKRYDKFKKNNLPTPFYDEERQTMEYVYYIKDILDVRNSLADALGSIAFTGLYYSFSSKLITYKKAGRKNIKNIKFGHNHAHSFEEVVRELYNYPESFKISKDEEHYYSKQELEYIRRVKKYLLFIGLKDKDDYKTNNRRYQNKLQKKYREVAIYSFKNDVIKNMLNGKRNFRVIKWFPGFEMTGFKFKKFKALIVDEEDNYRLFVEFTHEEVKEFKDIKKLYKNPNLKDNDKVIVCYFKVLEKY